jgi:hypothetical protein
MPNCDVCTRFYSDMMKPVCGVDNCPLSTEQRGSDVDCPPTDYPTDETRCAECPRRARV